MDKDEERLRDMRDAAVEAMGLCSQIEREDLDDSRVLTLALVKLLEIVGEAARNISQKRMHKEAFDFGDVIGLRDGLVHQYNSIDLDLLWSTVKIELPVVLTTLEGVAKHEGGGSGAMGGGPP